MSVLATTALLGNIGQFILSDEIVRRNITTEFESISQVSGSIVAEAELFNLLTEDVTAELFDFWNIDPLVSDSIRYAYDFQNAPQDIKPYALANYIVYSCINTSDELLDEEGYKDMLLFIEEMNFDVKHFEKAYQSVCDVEFF